MGAGSRLRPGPTLRQHQKTFDRRGLLCHPPHILGLTMAQTTLNCIPYPHPRPQGLPAACPPAHLLVASLPSRLFMRLEISDLGRHRE